MGPESKAGATGNTASFRCGGQGLTTTLGTSENKI
jgi:hypothetical protein